MSYLSLIPDVGDEYGDENDSDWTTWYYIQYPSSVDVLHVFSFLVYY